MIVVIDTETTGLPNEPRARVIEIGAVCVDAEGNEFSSFSALIKPTAPLGAWADPALEICQIKPEWLDAASSSEVVWESLWSWMRLHRPVTQIFAYNVEFDKLMMERTFPDMVRHLPWGPCLMVAAAQHIHGPKRQRLALKKAAAHFDIPMHEAHRALGDARTAAAVGAAIQRAKNVVS